ncbi:MAG: nucleotidyl transferase AbiEii/AbiGii toxin family protein [Magnetococcales bacterium]|nr:nucleotidyl transferase AbiEii/AbiGii toxin family protein [Magnetococcales bacterium]
MRANLRKWVDSTRANPTQHIKRILTEILLITVSKNPQLREGMYLKGGLLMGLGYHSERATVDIDFTAHVSDPAAFHNLINTGLNRALQKTINLLGYMDYGCRVQSIKKRPANRWPGGSELALKISIGIAKKNTNEHKRLLKGQCTTTVRIDLSFYEETSAPEEMTIDDSSIYVYGIHDLVSEKMRALLQASTRHGRNRRQDVFDIAWVLDQRQFTDEDRQKILDLLQLKSKSRGITPTKQSMGDPEVKSMAQKKWHTLKMEIGELPDFEPLFEKVAKFYNELPWKQ